MMSLGKNHHHWSTIGDPHIFIWNNQIFIGDPRFSLETFRFLLDTPYFRWIPHIFVGGPQILAGVSAEKMGSPMKILGSQMKIWGSPIKTWGYPIKIWRAPTRIWGAFNETSMGSPTVLRWWWFLPRHSLFQLFHENFKLSPEACAASTIPWCGGEQAFLKEDFKNERTFILTSLDEDEELVQKPEQARQ